MWNGFFGELSIGHTGEIATVRAVLKLVFWVDTKYLGTVFMLLSAKIILLLNIHNNTKAYDDGYPLTL